MLHGLQSLLCAVANSTTAMFCALASLLVMCPAALIPVSCSFEEPGLQLSDSTPSPHCSCCRSPRRHGKTTLACSTFCLERMVFLWDCPCASSMAPACSPATLPTWQQPSLSGRPQLQRHSGSCGFPTSATWLVSKTLGGSGRSATLLAADLLGSKSRVGGAGLPCMQQLRTASSTASTQQWPSGLCWLAHTQQQHFADLRTHSKELFRWHEHTKALNILCPSVRRLSVPGAPDGDR